MRRLPSGADSKGLFEIVALIVLAGLLLLLVWIQSSRPRRKQQKSKSNRRSFADVAGQDGLGERERSLLLLVAERAGLKQPESIFSMSTAFDRGAEMVIQEHLDQNETPLGIEQLKVELSFLREKLHFRVGPSLLGAPTAGPRLSTRQIPVGRKLSIIAAETSGAGNNIEGTVIGNNTGGLKVRLSESIDTMAGDQWSVRCPCGTSIWEFDSEVLEYGGGVLDLSHTSSIRLASRRRFPRVAVRMPAFVKRFSFAVVPIHEINYFAESGRTDGYSRSSESDAASGAKWIPPEFTRAVVTELAGPGMRIESQLHAPVGKRVLIVLGLNDEREHSAEDGQATGQEPSRVLEDIAIVRHVKRTLDGWSMAVELIGLSDTNVDELIHATNAAVTKLSDLERAAASERVLESALVQGA